MVANVLDSFLLYSPLNQGLKLDIECTVLLGITVFTLQSIKSRIETQDVEYVKVNRAVFLLYSPLNQGLKRITESS